MSPYDLQLSVSFASAPIGLDGDCEEQQAWAWAWDFVPSLEFSGEPETEEHAEQVLLVSLGLQHFFHT